MKRFFDLLIGSVLSIAAVPLVLLGALGSAIVLRSWPFFIQTRVGRDGELFRFIKVRTLPKSFPAYADKYCIGELPRFCSLMRRLHLDELPQLLLVPLGKMSLIGPRPEMPGLHAALDPRFAAERTSVRPGCTGLWQIGNQSHRLIGESPEFDRFYLRNHTLRLDLWIFMRSVRALFPGARMITLEDVPNWTGSVLVRRPVEHVEMDPTPVPVDA